MRAITIFIFLFPILVQSQISKALIPLPQKVTWGSESLSLKKCSTILINDGSLFELALALKNKMNLINPNLEINNTKHSDVNTIKLSLQPVKAPINAEEAYELVVNSNGIILNANTKHGLFNGLQTLFQLIQKSQVNTCKIIDWPSFSWRGFMIDVGRNFQSIAQIKQQIEVMAAYKLNVFHFHLTENIAWRLFIKQYPQLTDKQYMLRNQGSYYTETEMHDLIKYCKERYIDLIPEIDMPGHSDAFKRAMGVDMQSDTGIKICKNILTELCDKYDIKNVHIGGDEVAYSYKNFLKEIIEHVKTKQKNIIAWDPGGEVTLGTTLQMWNGNTKSKKGYKMIDSRHLYLNHFDPLEGVISVFNHQILDLPFGNDQNLGAILCNWPDRNVRDEKDLIAMNAVFPVMLTFAERTWRGGGWKNYLSDIGIPSSNRYQLFTEFENRLLQHQSIYFKNTMFPYVKQASLAWKLKGPYFNNGNTLTEFLPELNPSNNKIFNESDLTVYGGTIVLKHFWHPVIGGVLTNPEDSSTWYASRTIWSDVDTVKNFWIGFNNYSRSTATQPPPIGEWDDKHSKVWVNGKIIQPPLWALGGKSIDLEQPLIDEGYEYRTPTKIALKKGENHVLIKCPVKTFVGKDWQHPVKWMFTFVETPIN